MVKSQLIDAVKSAQNGDKQALEALYSEFAKPTYFLALKLLANQQDAEDLTQEVFLYAFTKIKELRSPEAFSVWLNRVTAHKCADFIRAKRPSLNIDDGEVAEAFLEETDAALIPEKAFDDAETSKIVMKVIDELPLPQKACVYYYYYERLSVKEIAEELAIKETTVKNRLALARDKIRKALEQLENKEGLKLYGASPMVLVPLLFNHAQGIALPAKVASGATSVITTALSGTASTVTTATSGSASTASASTAGTAAATGAGVKVIVGVAGALAAVGITAGIIAAISSNKDDGREIFDNSGSSDSFDNSDSQFDLEDALNFNDDVNNANETDEAFNETSEASETEAPVRKGGKVEIKLGHSEITDELLAQYVADGTIPQDATSLWIMNNEITDISPLAGLTNLTYLAFQGNKVSDISVLANLTNLEQLFINSNQISDVSALAGLTKVKQMFINDNEITDISALASMTSLKTLQAMNNQISDVSPLANISGITAIYLDENPVSKEQIAELQKALPDCEISS